MAKRRRIVDNVQEMVDATRKDGKHRRCAFDRVQFLKEIPTAEQDPRMSLMDKRPTIIIECEKNEHLEVGEMRKLIEANPDHPLAETFELAIMGLHDNQVIAVRCDQIEMMRTGQVLILPPHFNQGEGQKPEVKSEEPKKPEEKSGLDVQTTPGNQDLAGPSKSNDPPNPAPQPPKGGKVSNDPPIPLPLGQE